jgi:hypothetical protein
MKSSLADILKSRWFALLIHAGLWLLLVLAVMGFSGNLPNFNDTDSSATPPQSPIPVASLEQLSSTLAWPKLTDNTNLANPFSTKHFFPPPSAPPPPAPTTRKFELTYQGYYQSESGPVQTMLKLGTNFVITPVGSRVLSNLFVAHATLQFLTLTNTSAKTNVLPLATPREVEVPIQ